MKEKRSSALSLELQNSSDVQKRHSCDLFLIAWLRHTEGDIEIRQATW